MRYRQVLARDGVVSTFRHHSSARCQLASFACAMSRIGASTPTGAKRHLRRANPYSQNDFSKSGSSCGRKSFRIRLQYSKRASAVVASGAVPRGTGRTQRRFYPSTCHEQHDEPDMLGKMRVLELATSARRISIVQQAVTKRRGVCERRSRDPRLRGVSEQRAM
jgi:hypothetical protein